VRVPPSDETRAVFAQLKYVQTSEAEVTAALHNATNLLTECDKLAILEASTHNGIGQPTKSYVKSAKEARTAIVEFEGKIRACGVLKSEIRAKIFASMEKDKSAVIKEMRVKSDALKQDEGRLRDEYTLLLAQAKVAEIKFRGWQKRWIEECPGIGPSETDLMGAFRAELKQILELTGIDELYVSPGSALLANVPRVRMLESAVSERDFESARALIEREEREAARAEEATAIA
jgi:hypothetical protein